MKHGKKYNDSAKLIDRAKLYDAEEAVDGCCQDRQLPSLTRR